MKVFWSILLALVIVTAVLLFTQGSDGNNAAETNNPVTPTANPSAPSLANDTSTPTDPNSGNATTGESTAGETDASGSNTLAGTNEPSAPANTNEQNNETVATTEGANDSAAPTTPAPEQTKPKANQTGTVERRDDGALVLDGRFVIRGEGTAAKPYVVPWDLLVSAQDTYQPRLGKTEVPERIAMLDGKQVKITGYIAFPLMVSQANELLLMMNQWDGCCVGVPPTPYDGIEVRLSRAVPASSGINVFHYGSITGTFKVDPYIVNNWLVGLFMIEEASLEMEM